jgi:hypothetical protein
MTRLVYSAFDPLTEARLTISQVGVRGQFAEITVNGATVKVLSRDVVSVGEVLMEEPKPLASAISRAYCST